MKKLATAIVFTIMTPGVAFASDYLNDRPQDRVRIQQSQAQSWSYRSPLHVPQYGTTSYVSEAHPRVQYTSQPNHIVTRTYGFIPFKALMLGTTLPYVGAFMGALEMRNFMEKPQPYRIHHYKDGSSLTIHHNGVAVLNSGLM